jgi:hypothetical protein
MSLLTKPSTSDSRIAAFLNLPFSASFLASPGNMINFTFPDDGDANKGGSTLHTQANQLGQQITGLLHELKANAPNLPVGQSPVPAQPALQTIPTVRPEQVAATFMPPTAQPQVAGGRLLPPPPPKQGSSTKAPTPTLETPDSSSGISPLPFAQQQQQQQQQSLQQQHQQQQHAFQQAQRQQLLQQQQMLQQTFGFNPAGYPPGAYGGYAQGQQGFGGMSLFSPDLPGLAGMSPSLTGISPGLFGGFGAPSLHGALGQDPLTNFDQFATYPQESSTVPPSQPQLQAQPAASAVQSRTQAPPAQPRRALRSEEDRKPVLDQSQEASDTGSDEDEDVSDEESSQGKARAKKRPSRQPSKQNKSSRAKDSEVCWVLLVMICVH